MKRPSAAFPIVSLLALASSACDGGSNAPAVAQADSYHVTIRQTSYGIPHILADDLPSAAAGEGYVAARDFGCILLDQIVRVRSERAKFFGPGDSNENLTSDFGMLTLDVLAKGKSGLAMQTDDLKKAVDGYVAGFNRYLDKEKLAADCQGEPWARPLTADDLFAYYYWLAQLGSADPLFDYIGAAAPPTADAPSTQNLRALPRLGPRSLGSNGWALGSDKTETGKGLLLANPHFPWEGNRKFYESQITVPGVVNVYGASLLGSPVINIGFNENVAWTHTVTTARHFTLYKLTLADGDPTSYMYDGKSRAMTSKKFTIDVLQPDGSTASVDRTLYSSHYGPIVAVDPLGGWTKDTTYSFRNANDDNFGLGQQWLGMDEAKGLDDLESVNRKVQGIPWVNTMAIDASGTALYMDASRTPNLTPAALKATADALATDAIVQAVNAQGATLLDGSDSTFEWVDDPKAVAPGIVSYDASPRQQRKDYVFNANDSYWLTNASAPLTGYSLMFGDERTERSTRTRMNLLMLTEQKDDGVSGADGKFSFDELSGVEFGDRESLIEVLLDQVLARCDGVTTVTVPAGTSMAGAPSGGSVDITGACATLGKWDRRFKLDSVGAVLWREFIVALAPDARFADAFDPDDPIATPKTLAAKPDSGDDPVLVALATAVTTLNGAGIAITTSLGDAQHTKKGDDTIPIHGGLDPEGAFNVVDFTSATGVLLPTLQRDTTLSDSGLTKDGYLVNFGSSFMMVLEYTPDGPHAQAVLSYSQSSDPASSHYADQTELFSQSKYRPVVFTEDDIMADPKLETTLLDVPMSTSTTP
ncbi:MAG TPA: acylase [Polyangiaceae bacterium]|jgi:acyl-homoserine-lactone acylase|nr:acylase [Polyangiaceae bacterium]